MFTTGTYLNWKASTAKLHANPAISNTQGKQKLVQYSELVISEHSLRQIKSKGNEKPFNIVGIHYQYHMFQTAEFDCVCESLPSVSRI